MSRFHEQIHGVYFDDLDPYGILHNARYLLLFEHAIGSFWRHMGWGGPLDFNDNPDQYHLVRSNHIEYLRPVKGTGEVRVRVWVDKLGTTSLTFGLGSGFVTGFRHRTMWKGRQVEGRGYMEYIDRRAPVDSDIP